MDFGQLQPAALRPDAAVRILPAGQFRANDGRPFNLPCWTLTAANAASIVQASLQRKDDFLIDYEHQTLNVKENGKPNPAAGWFSQLEWVPDQGLFMKGMKWTDRARELIAANEYRYLSPVFAFDKAGGNVTALVNVALTNSPALVGLTDLAAEASAQGLSRCMDGVQALKQATLSASCSGDALAILAAAEVRMGICASAGKPIPYCEAIQQVTSEGPRLRAVWGEGYPRTYLT